MDILGTDHTCPILWQSLPGYCSRCPGRSILRGSTSCRQGGRAKVHDY